MRQSEHLQPDYSICIICEGENTEPYFYGDLIAWMERERWPLDYQYRIFPVPVSREESDSDNSHRLKWHSLATLPVETEVYERNPYLDSYRLTLRLMGYRSLEHGDTFYHKVGNGEFHLLKRNSNTITFKNDSRVTLKIPTGSISVMKAFTESRPKINVEMQIKDNLEEIEVQPNSEYSISLANLLQHEDYYLKISWSDNIFFCAREDGIGADFDMSLFDLSSC